MLKLSSKAEDLLERHKESERKIMVAVAFLVEPDGFLC
jgi:hypothetical protein